MAHHRRDRSSERKEISTELLLSEKEEYFSSPWEKEVVEEFTVVPSDLFDIRVFSRNTLHINGFRIHGEISEGNACSECGHRFIFDYDHDSYFCPGCNIWTEGDRCGDPDCRFCSNRPDKPLPDFGVNDGKYPQRDSSGWDNVTTLVE